MSGKILRVAVVGAGVGNSHVEGYRTHPDRYHVAAVCDLDLQRAQKTAGAGQNCRAVTDLADVLNDDSIDLIDVALPPHLHFKTTMAALEAGKHVICEKPLATSLREVDQIAEKARAVGRQVYPVFQYRYGLGFQRLLHLVDQGMAGRPFVASLETHWKRGADYYAVPWRGTWAGEQGGSIVGHAIHIHNLATRLLGPVVKVAGFLDTMVNRIETEDCAAVAMQMQSGALVTSSITLGASGDMSRMRVCYEHVTAESDLLPYTIGAGDWTFTATDPARQAEFDAALAKITDVPQRYGGLVGEIHKALTGDVSAAPPTFAEARHSIELITAIYQAQRTQSVVDLPLDEAHPLYGGWSLEASELK